MITVTDVIKHQPKHMLKYLEMKHPTLGWILHHKNLHKIPLDTAIRLASKAKLTMNQFSEYDGVRLLQRIDMVMSEKGWETSEETKNRRLRKAGPKKIYLGSYGTKTL